MAHCYLCKVETMLYINGLPICVKCADEQEKITRKKGRIRESEATGHQESRSSDKYDHPIRYEICSYVP